jgi:iron complex outermembrane receptor protein
VSGKLSHSLDYLVGFYTLYAYSGQNIPLSVAPDLTFGPLSVFRRVYNTRNNSNAIYGQSTYGITDQLHLTLGGRYTREEGKFNPAEGDANAALGVTAARRVDSKPSWTVSLDYKLTPDLMFYATQRGSWRTGGFNGTAADFNPDGTLKGVNQFEPETTYDFEVGSKFSGAIADMPVRANLAVYDQTVKNVIRAIYIGVSAVSGNVKKARISGVEFDGSINPTPWLQLGNQRRVHRCPLHRSARQRRRRNFSIRAVCGCTALVWFCLFPDRNGTADRPTRFAGRPLRAKQLLLHERRGHDPARYAAAFVSSAQWTRGVE